MGSGGRACICGSMHSGKRLARAVRMPFWTDSSSAGRPSAAHCATSSSLVRKASSLRGAPRGVLASPARARCAPKLRCLGAQLQDSG